MVEAGVVAQRAAMHRWKNMSRTEGARFLVVSLGVEGAVEGGMESGGEELGYGCRYGVSEDGECLG